MVVSYNVYVMFLDLRLLYVLEICSDLLRGCQMLLRTWIVIKVDFLFLMKHAMRHGQLRWDLPLSKMRDISWALKSSDLQMHDRAT